MDPLACSPNSPQQAWSLPHSGPEQPRRFSYRTSFLIARRPAGPCGLRSCPHVPHVLLCLANHLDSVLPSAPQRRICQSLHSLCTIPTVRPCCLFLKITCLPFTSSGKHRKSSSIPTASNIVDLLPKAVPFSPSYPVIRPSGQSAIANQKNIQLWYLKVNTFPRCILILSKQ